MSTSNWLRETPEGVIVAVRVRPRSSRAGFESVLEDALSIRLRSAPVEGKANKELIETLADLFDVAKSRVRFVAGETSKTKRLLVAGVSASDVQAVIEQKG